MVRIQENYIIFFINVLNDIIVYAILHIIAEDNNTRVLFERVLSSGSSLEPEKSVYVYLYDVKFFTTLS